MTIRRGSLVLLIFGVGLGLRCGSVEVDSNQNFNQPVDCTEGEHRCQASDWEVCEGGVWVFAEHCDGLTPHCTVAGGCGPCVPESNYCDGDAVRACNADGSPGDIVETCAGGNPCEGGVCISLCEVAEATRSYIGCEYWPTTTINIPSELDEAFEFNFGVVVHNANSHAAHVTITRNSIWVAEADVQPGQLHTFELRYVSALNGNEHESVKVPGGAYRLNSTLPVTAYQFSPLDFSLNGAYSYTNDASLLLPTHALSTSYIVMARQTFGITSGVSGSFQFTPGFFAVVGTQNATWVTITYSAHTAGGDVDAVSPGAEITYYLDQGEVLQVLSGQPSDCTGAQSSNDCGGGGGTCDFCDAGPQYDLTGTIISSTAPVAVFGGHVCSFVPYCHPACDHLEEQILPLETWGKEIVVGRTEPQHQPGFPEEPNLVRILSGADGNLITFDPPQPGVGAATELGKGEWVEFESLQDFHVQAASAILVGQYLVGENYYSTPDPNCTTAAAGDPSFAQMVPMEQYRTQYMFLAPSTMTYNYVNVTKRVHQGGPVVYLDASPIPEAAFSEPVGTTQWGVARLPIDGTPHSIESTEPFGIMVYGFACYTSYSYPGGLDLNFINPVE